MKALFIGGTGTISTAITKLAVQKGVELYLLNRGNHNDNLPEGIKYIQADIYNEEEVNKKLEGMTFDVVADFIVFDTKALERDIRLFKGKTKQYIFISSASAYQKPLASPVITENTPLMNPYWEYSRNKISCEELLLKEYRENGFPFTIIRPSHTYGDTSIPLAVHGTKGPYSVIKRMLEGKKVIVHGDGSSLWTVTHNSDFAVAFLGIMNNPHAIGETFQITSDESLTWNQIYQIIGDALGVQPKIVHIPSDTLARCCTDFVGSLLGDKTHTVIFDNTKVKRLVPEYKAVTRFDEGIRISLANLFANKELQVEDPEFDEFTDKLINAYEAFEKKLPTL